MILLKNLILFFLFIGSYYSSYSQVETKSDNQIINVNEVIGIYTLCDTSSHLDVSFEIKNNYKFKSIKINNETKTIGKGNWRIAKDTLILEDIKSKQIPKPKTEQVFSQNEIKIVSRSNKLYVVLADGRPAGNICIEKK